MRESEKISSPLKTYSGESGTPELNQSKWGNYEELRKNWRFKNSTTSIQNVYYM